MKQGNGESVLLIEENEMEEVLSSVAPCSLFCSTCTACCYGKISYHAKELLRLLEGHEEFLDKNLKKKYRYKLDEFKMFSKKLKKYAYPKCAGCRNGSASGCSIKGCIISDCTREHKVDFCAMCDEFPCNKVNESIYKKNVVEKWLKGNMQIKKDGIRKYYEENKDKPHYIEHVKKTRR